MSCFNLCACGCGEKIKQKSDKRYYVAKYINGHYWKGKKQKKEVTNKRIKRGKDHYNYKDGRTLKEYFCLDCGKKLITEDYDSVLTVREEPLYEWKDNKPAYLINDSILYACNTSFALEHKKRYNCLKTFLLKTSKIEAIDINEEEDFKFAEIVYKGLL